MRDIKGLAGSSAIYGIGSILGRALSFLLLPVYTHYLTPSDYGTIAIAGTVTMVLGILIPLGLHGAIPKFYFEASSAEERRRVNGTLWVAILLVASIVLIVTEVLGPSIFPTLLPQFPFRPFGRLALWTAFFNAFSYVPLAVLQISQRPRAYVAVTFCASVLSALATMLAVVMFHGGALGFLRASCGAAAVMAGVYLVLTLQAVRPSMTMGWLRRAVVFALPLVPHGLATWVLDVSDKLLLQRYVTPHEVGLYALGVQFGAIMSVLTTAINSAWVPFVYKRVGEDPDAARAGFSRLSTVYVVVLVMLALALALLGQDAIVLFAAPAFREATSIVPWIVGGYFFLGLYLVPANFLFVGNRTTIIPLATLTAGGLNVLLNMWLMPRYGITAAAWTTLGCYAIMFLIVWGGAQRVYRVPYEYGKIARLIGVGVAGYGALRLSADPGRVGAAVHIAGLVCIPLLIWWLGGWSVDERGLVAQQLRQRWVSRA